MDYKPARQGARREQRYEGGDPRLARLARFLIRHRRGALILQLLVFVVCIWSVLGLPPEPLSRLLTRVASKTSPTRFTP